MENQKEFQSMGSNTAKVKKELDLGDVGDFLRDLAEAFDNQVGGGDNDTGAHLQDFYKIEIRMKRQMTAVSLKMKIEHDETADTEAPSDDHKKLKCKKLKKQMQATFKAIRNNLSESSLPDSVTVQTFMRDALIMVSYPDYGDEYYEAFAETCQRFSQAYESGDLEAVKTAFAEIDQMKKDCHNRYK